MPSAKKGATETDLARFFRLFHDQYPTSLSKARRAAIRSIAAKVLARQLTWEEGLEEAGIPIEQSDEDVSSFDSAYRFFVWMIMFMFLSTMLGAFPDSKQERGPSISPEDQQRIFAAFRQTFEETPPDEPEEWIDVGGKPTPVLGSPGSNKKPKRRRPRSRKQTQSETDGAPKRRRRAPAKKKR
jgi:hypothetical protein